MEPHLKTCVEQRQVHLSQEAIDQHERNQGRRLSIANVAARRMSVASTHSQASTGHNYNPGRRQSRAGSLVASTLMGIGMRRLARIAAGGASENIKEIISPKLRMENTYRMEPEESTKFSCPKVEACARAVLEQVLEGEIYDSDTIPQLTCEICTLVKNKIKDLNFARYKIVVNAIIGERNDQGFEAASSSIWNPKTDTFSSVSYKNKSLFATIYVHGVYFE